MSSKKWKLVEKITLIGFIVFNTFSAISVSMKLDNLLQQIWLFSLLLFSIWAFYHIYKIVNEYEE
jgi:prepilin signal peptidase PulO-like enzyme (type II secretory pathway)